MNQRDSGLPKNIMTAGEPALQNVKWIRGGTWLRPTIYTPCFHNPCPRGRFTFYIIATCSFTV